VLLYCHLGQERSQVVGRKSFKEATGPQFVDNLVLKFIKPVLLVCVPIRTVQRSINRIVQVSIGL
jgi:hypothetical protein